ncbi:HipA domain-containing protein [Lysobacter sp. CW239]|uniref:type II toxin-antitoxin system HipA family toxin n=1 Tax=Lysobacter sp. CW239 TaxID=2762611 RepID=UPI0017464F47|nr:HipA domain-containing protein [Lysobacter sp. CW239]
MTRSSSKTGEAVSFEYSPQWLDGQDPIAGFQLDPQLYLAGGQIYSRAGADRLSGSFVDCSPDRWGKLLMDRREAIEAREQDRRVRNLREWDYLVGVNDESRMGALRLWDNEEQVYRDARGLSSPPITDLRELEAAAEAVERGDPADTALMRKWLMQLIAPGASLGGARPKASFRDVDGSLWLAKFPSTEDRRNVGLWELLAYQLSLDAGIVMPPAKVLRLSGRGHTYAVTRFDRMAGSRRAYASAMTLLDATESEGFSYLDLVLVIEREGASTTIAADLEQLFRRVMFNILIGNRDDHLRNHGFLRQGNGWRLSPAFDVNPNPDKHDHVLAIDESDTSPDTALLLSSADYYRLGKRVADEIAEQIRAVVRGWEKRAETLGLRGHEVDVMRGVIDPER